MSIVRLLIAMTCLAIATIFLLRTDMLSGYFNKFNPIVGQPYPDLEYINQDGRTVRISDFKGNVVIVELIGMPCKACHAWSGAHEKGAFLNIAPQPQLESFKNYFESISGLRWGHPGIIFLQIIFYDINMQHPTADDAKRWATHFGFKTTNREHVLVPKQDLRSDRLYQQIPGFQLLDKKIILRVDGTDPHQDQIYSVLLPSVEKLLLEPL